MLKFVAAIAALLFAALAASQDYPSRPIRLIVPFPPGGSTDILARALGDKLAQGLGQPVVIDNRPGAAGSIGAEAAARAAPDGHTLMMGHLGTLAVNPAIYKNLPYDPVKSFAPVTSAAELIAYAKAHPGKLAYGSAGNGSTSHLTTEYFKLVTGTDILHVPYKGVGPMLTDLVSGQLSMGLNGAPSVMQHVNSGRLRALAVTSLKRLEALPQVRTLDEAGVRGFDASGWYGVIAPAGTPQAIVARLNAAVGRAIQTPELRARPRSEGALAAPGTPEEFAALIRAEIARWETVLKRAGVQAQ